MVGRNLGTADSESQLKPFLRWAGSKRQQLKHLVKIIPHFEGRYIEPFAGSACLFWHLRPGQAVLSDLNSALIGCYQRVALAPDAVHDVYRACLNEPDEYYRIREAFHEAEDPDERAGYFIFLNRYCFNGLYRTDKNGRFNVPYGGERTGSTPTLSELRSYSRILSNVTLECGDFEQVVSKHVRESDLVYLDPPYFSTSSRVFNAYTKTPFQQADLDRFGKLLMRIDALGATFVATYLEGDEIADIASQWNSCSVSALRRMSGFTRGRKRTSEVVLTNSKGVK